MMNDVVRTLTALGLAIGGGSAMLAAQGQGTAAAQVHIEAARKAAAGTEHAAVFDRTCNALTPPPRATAPAAPRPAGPPARESWYVEPAKVFDNLYFLGQSEYSSWAVALDARITP